MLVSWSGGRRGPRRLLRLHLMGNVQSEPDPSSFSAFPEAGGINQVKWGIRTHQRLMEVGAAGLEPGSAWV